MNYQILPYRFHRCSSEEYLLTNDAGEYIFLKNAEFEKLNNGTLTPADEAFYDLASKQIITCDRIEDVVHMLAVKFRTKKSILRDFTSLHMVVPTIRCNSSCIYCQVARRTKCENNSDMSFATAKNVVKTIFQSPSHFIKIEFQGGDPSVRFDLVEYIIEEVELANIRYKKELSFVICTNLTLLDEKKVKYLKKHNCLISTSLDGPKDLHDINRPLQDKTLDHHAVFETNLKMIRKIWNDNDCVSALMTTSKFSLGRFREIIDEYIRLGFNNIFLRQLNPYGFAKKYKDKISYPVEDFIENYKEGLDYIIELNKRGTFFVEGYARLLLRRILTPFATGFVDLQSPAGAGISCAIYDYDGNVYVSDEARMMARFKNYFFKLGNVNQDTFASMFGGEHMRSITSQACTECLPMCADCVYQPYCGADPVRNYSEQGDVVGFRPTNEVCRKNKAIMDYLFTLLRRNDPAVQKIFWSWVR